MNKLFTKIATAFVGIAMAIGAGVAVANNNEAVPVHAASVISGTSGSLTFSSSNKVSTSGDTVTDSAGASWTFTTDSDYIAMDSNNTIVHTGSGSKTCSHQTWTTADYSGVTISSVVVTASTNGSASASVTINGNAVGSVQSLSSTASGKTFNNTNSFKGGNLVVTLSRSSATKKNILLTSIVVNYSAGTSYKTTVSVTGGAKSTTNTSTSFSSTTKSGDVYLTPSEGYRIPTSGLGSAFTISTGTATISSITDNGDGDVKVSLTGVSSDFTIGGSFEAIPKHTVTYSAGANGTGSYAHTNQYEGTYKLLDFEDLTGVSANSGYRFKNYTVGGVNKNPGDTFTLSAATPVTVNFEEQPDEFTAYFGTTSGGDSASSTALTTDIDSSLKNDYSYIIDSNITVSAMSAGYPQDSKTLKLGSNNNIGSITVGIPSTVDSKSVYISNVVVVAKRYHATNGTNITISSGDSSINKTLTTSFDTYTADISSEEATSATISTASTTSDKRFYIQAIHLEYMFKDNLNEDLVISEDYTDSFTVGDTFEFGGSYIKADYSVSGLVTVTDVVTFELAGSSISEGDTITGEMVGTGVEVGVWYEDAKGNEAAGSYTVDISYEKVTSVEIKNYPSTGELPKDGTFTFGATVLPETANPAVKWSASSETLVENDDFYIDEDTGELTLTASEGGTITITATTVGKTAGDVTLSDTYDLEVTGDPVVTLNHSALAGYSGKSGSLTAEAANFGGAVTYSWSSDNACVTVPNNNVATNTLTYVSAGTATVTVTATYQSQSASASCIVTVTASTVTSLSWNASNFDVYDNQSLSALPGTLTATWNNGDTTHPTSGYTLAIGGSPISLPHAWSTNDDGKSFTVTYGEQSASVSIQVTEHLNTITETSWTKVTDATTLTAGDKLVIASDSKGKVATDISSQIMGKVDTVFKDGKISGDLDSSAVQLTLGGSSGAWTLQNSAGKYLSATAEKKLAWADSSSGNTWTISISGGDATITFATSTYGKFMYNVSSPRFTTYTSNASSTMLLVQLYRRENTSINDTNSTAQRALISFAKTFNTTMACDDGGDTANVESKWSSASSAFTTAMNALGTDDKAVFKKLVANASAVKGGDSLQDMLARYDYIIAKYKLSNDFLHDGADRGAVQYARFTPLNAVINSNNSIVIIIITSMASLAAIGGYFFLRKKKED